MNVLIRKIKTVLTNPKSILIKTMYFISPIFTDDIYLKILFYLQFGYRLDLNNPNTYSEKLQWLKINFREPFLSNLVDKYEVKNFVANKIGIDFVIKNYGVWDNFEQIEFGKLPNQFVLKTTHDQGGIVICKDKRKFNFKEAKKKLNKHLKVKHYYLSREWPYKNVKPRIIAEEYFENKNGEEINDYKFFCFNGKVKLMFIASGRQSGKLKFDYFDMNFNKLDISQTAGQSTFNFKKPDNLDEMIRLSEILSLDFPHVRMDFYNIDGMIKFGEYTFFDSGGLLPFKPFKWDEILGSYIDLDYIKK